MLYWDTADESSALPRSHAGHCRAENSKNKMFHLHFLAWSIPDHHVSPTHKDHMSCQIILGSPHTKEINSGSWMVFLSCSQSDRPSQSINFLVLRLRCSLAKRSLVQGARSLTQILIQCLWFCKTISAPTSLVQWLQYQKGKQDYVERTSTCI